MPAHRAPAGDLAVGIGSAGVIDPRTGIVLSATDAITDWPGTRIAHGIAERLRKRGFARLAVERGSSSPGTGSTSVPAAADL